MPRFLLYALLIYALINLGILGWFWGALSANPILRWPLLLALSFAACCFPIFFKNGSSSALDLALLTVGALWAGTLTYLLLMILGSEALLLLKRLFGWGAQTADAIQQFRYLASLTILALAVVIGLLSGWNAKHPVVKEIELTIQVKRPAGAPPLTRTNITFGAVSDVHLGRLISARWLADALELLRPHQPEALFFLGDTLDDHIRVDPEPVRKALQSLHPALGVWGILGNHEYISGELATSLDLLEKSGIPVLRDSWTVLDDSILLVGRDDYSGRGFTGKARASLDQILQSVPANYRALPLIVLDHQPVKLEEAEQSKAALQLSGHTHNGQLWPFNFIVKKVYENAYGHYTRGDSHYFTSLGLGSWGSSPQRSTGRPEILLFRVRFVTE